MVIVIGSTNLDQVGLVSRMPGPGETVAGSDFLIFPGGKGANQALAARRAGAEVRFHSAVGDDLFAAQALKLLQADGVDLSGVTTAATHTGIAMILVDGAGENSIAVLPGANATVDAAHVERAFAGAGPGDVLLLQQEVPVATNHLALDRARQLGLRSILNIAPFLPQTPEMAAKADILIANETEFALLTGVAATPASVAARAEAAHQLVIVTLGPEGALMSDGGPAKALPARRVEVVDTVGAGDTFCGYFGAGLEAGLPEEDAARQALTAGSLAVTRQGAQTSIPRLAEVKAG